MHFLGKRTIFAGLLLIAGLATLHGTSKKQIDQYDLTRTYRPYEQLLSGDVNLKERIEREIISCENCGSNEHIMVDADVLRSFITENNKALFTAHKIKSFWLDGTSEHITEEEKES